MYLLPTSKILYQEVCQRQHSLVTKTGVSNFFLNTDHCDHLGKPMNLFLELCF